MSIWHLTARARGWFFKALVGAAGVSIITFIGWLITTHINLMSENREQMALIIDQEDSIKAQWGVISRLQDSNSNLSTQVGVLTRIQADIIIPTLRENHGKNIHYDIPLLGRDIEIYTPADIEAPPLFDEEPVDSEDFSREQTEIEKRIPRD